MEALVTIVEVGAYSERQFQRQDGTAEYFKSRGFVLKRGGDVVYGELIGEAASKNRDTQYYQNQPYIVRGSWILTVSLLRSAAEGHSGRPSRILQPNGR